MNLDEQIRAEANVLVPLSQTIIDWLIQEVREGRKNYEDILQYMEANNTEAEINLVYEPRREVLNNLREELEGTPEANNRLNLAITAAQNVANNAAATQEAIREAIESLRVFSEAAEGTNEYRA